MLTKYTIRILLMPVIYGTEAWAALRYSGHAVPYKLLREGYEAFVIFSFMQFLLAYMGGAVPLARRLNMKRRLGYREQRHFFPCNMLLPSWKLGAQFVRLTLVGTLQYVPASLVVMALSLGAWSLGAYDEGDWRPTNVYFYCALITNCSQIWAMYCLVMIYHATHDELKPIRPFGKFLSVKLVVFFTFWQSVGIGVLERVEGRGGVLDEMQKGIVADDTQFDDFFFESVPSAADAANDATASASAAAAAAAAAEYDRHHDNESFSTALQNFVLCVEMLLFALGHIWAFPADEWESKTNPSYMRLYDGFDASQQKQYGHFGYGPERGLFGKAQYSYEMSPARRSNRDRGGGPHSGDGSMDSESESDGGFGGFGGLLTEGGEAGGGAEKGGVLATAGTGGGGGSSTSDNSPSSSLTPTRLRGELPTGSPDRSGCRRTSSGRMLFGSGSRNSNGSNSGSGSSSSSSSSSSNGSVDDSGLPGLPTIESAGSLAEGGASSEDVRRAATQGETDHQTDASTPQEETDSNSPWMDDIEDGNQPDVEGGGEVAGLDGPDRDQRKRRLQSMVMGQVKQLGDQIGQNVEQIDASARAAWEHTATTLQHTGQVAYGVAEHQTHQVIDSTKLVGQAMVDVPMGVASTIYDGVGNVARSTVNLPVNIGRAAYDGGIKVGAEFMAEDNRGEGVLGVVQKTGHVLGAVGEIPVNMARQFGTGVVDIARNTVELPVRTVGSAVGGTVNLANVTSTQVLRNVPLLPPLHKEEFRDGINFSDIWSSIQTVKKK